MMFCHISCNFFETEKKKKIYLRQPCILTELTAATALKWLFGRTNIHITVFSDSDGICSIRKEF